MTFSKFTMKTIDISSHKMSPREEDSFEFQPPVTHDYDDDSESEFDDFEDDSGWFATYVQESSKPAKRRSSVKKFSLKEPTVKTRSSITKYTAPLKETSKQTRRSSVRLLCKSKRTTEQDFQKVRDIVGRSSLYLHRDRLQCSKVTAPKAT